MQVFIVTSLAKEENPVGNILKAMCRCQGVFTSESMANAVAEKYGGGVASFYLDNEDEGRVLLYWENPGFVSS